jgi:predicted transcriptional regulator
MLRSKSLPISHTFKYRDRVSIISDILTTVKNSRKGRRKTQIMQSANLNYNQTRKYLDYLLTCGYLVVTEKETYLITNEGSRFLQLFDLQRIRMVT